LAPDDVTTHIHLGAALADRGQTDEAIREYREALRLVPENLTALNNLAWLLVTAPDVLFRDRAEAVRMAEQACRQTHRKDPALLDTLAAAYAAAGRFDEAVLTAEEASRLALAAEAKTLADAIGARLELYRSSRSYSEPPTQPQKAR
jgi:spermidine synthase